VEGGLKFCSRADHAPTPLRAPRSNVSAKRDAASDAGRADMLAGCIMQTVEQTLMTKTEMQAEALNRARNGMSWSNYPAIIAGFVAKGIPEQEIKPRENVLSFHAWKAVGRSVKKGEHGVKIITFIDCSAGERDAATGEEKTVSYRRPHSVTVFHISQTEATAERDARVGAMSGKGWSSRHAKGRYPNSRWASGHGRYPPVDPGYVDPGELAADRWNETHS
jgi:hypothetical protein